jgi:hypothetical protein
MPASPKVARALQDRLDGEPADLRAPAAPHWASAGADAFRYLALGLRITTLRPRPPVRVRPPAYGFTVSAQ